MTSDSVLIQLACSALFQDQIGILALATLSTIEQCSIEQCFGHTKRTSMRARDQPHRSIAISRKTRLKERRIESSHRCGNPGIEHMGCGYFLSSPRQFARGTFTRFQFDTHKRLIVVSAVECHDALSYEHS